MTYDTYRYIFIIAAVLCGIMVVTSVLLFILLRIPKVIGDLTGATARKAIEDIRNQNETSGDKTYKTSLVNKERGKLTDKISPSGSLMRDPSEPLAGAMATEKIGTQNLASNETTLLSEGGNETTLLSDVAPGGNETTLLAEPAAQAAPAAAFAIEYEITFIHTDEVIVAEVV